MTTLDDFLADSRVSAGEPAEPRSLEAAERELGVMFPADYKQLLLQHDGAEGPIGNSGYLVLWPTDELVSLNRDYAVQEFAPGLVLFGSDGGDTAYAFDTRTPSMPVVEVPFIGMDLETVEPVAETFTGFIERLSSE